MEQLSRVNTAIYELWHYLIKFGPPENTALRKFFHLELICRISCSCWTVLWFMKLKDGKLLPMLYYVTLDCSCNLFLGWQGLSSRGRTTFPQQATANAPAKPCSGSLQHSAAPEIVGHSSGSTWNPVITNDVIGHIQSYITRIPKNHQYWTNVVLHDFYAYAKPNSSNSLVY